MKTIGILLALGDIYSNSGIGSLNKPIDGGVSRFKAVTSNIPCDENSLIVCSAGYTQKNPSTPHPERMLSLAGQIARYINENEVAWNDFLIAKPLCWSTRNEVRLGIKLAINEQFVKRDEKVTLVISSNLSHLARVWLYTKLYIPKNWEVKIVRAHHQFSLFSHILEVPKIIRDVVYTVKVLNRLQRFKK
ncbi:MAG: hypothetical protein KBC41_04370 [Candidatus Pacebacteria bacterium]|nr:hypothetical protein [Candidatus Paceibacterota bacterium]MBP9867279.1 hypothetical protein [Candidatus Paceibacterota bacterium]